MKRSLTATAVAAALVVAAPAQAKTYTGKTRSGSAISFNATGSKVSKINTVVPATCVSAQGGVPKAGAELFRPPGAFGFGGEQQAKALQPAAMNKGSKATKNYRVTLKRSGAAITGKLHVNFSYLVPTFDAYGNVDSIIYICQGDDRFSVR